MPGPWEKGIIALLGAVVVSSLVTSVMLFLMWLAILDNTRATRENTTETVRARTYIEGNL